MIAVDASAVCAIAFAEPERDSFLWMLEISSVAFISPIGVWEARVTAERRGEAQIARVDEVLARTRMQVSEIGEAEANLAFAAWMRFGKTRHPASLNLGDCFAYALAKSRDLPLLYKGDDFAKTDVTSAI